LIIGRTRLDAYSKASQLSFFLWDAPPDLKLMAAAHSGELNTQSGLASEVGRMLESPRLESGLRAFFSDMLQFDLFDTLAKDAKIYPKWTVKVAQEAQEQTLRTIVDLVLTQHGDYRDLFTTRKTFLTPTLGSIYRVPVAQTPTPGSRTSSPKAMHAPASSPRQVRALHSHEGLSSPTLRARRCGSFCCASRSRAAGNVNLPGRKTLTIRTSRQCEIG